MRNGYVGVIALGLLTAACGTTQEQRAATGGLTGLGVGAAVGGPIEAAVGLAAGAAGGTLMPEDATTIANNALGREHRAANEMLNGNTNVASASTEGSGSSSSITTDHCATIRDAQTRLKEEGYYKGQVGGVVGPQTREALRAFQKHEGLRQTAQLDRETMQRLNQTASNTTGQAPANTEPPAASGSSAPAGGANNAQNAAPPDYSATPTPQTTAPAAPTNGPTHPQP